jgi:beta-barrel assembly-enhancing protease
MPSKQKRLLAVVTGMLLLALPILANRTPVKQAWNLFTVQQDVELGRQLAAEAQQSLNVVNDSWSAGYISALGNQLAANTPGYRYPYQFKIVDDSAINSFSLPGGFVYVTSGLVQAATTEPQLAGVLAHEIGHVVMRHATQEISADYRAEVPNASRVAVGTVMSRLGLGFESNSPVLRHTAQEERQADLIATQLLTDARFDARHMTAMFDRLNNEPANLTSEFRNNHPPVPNRLANVRREVQNMGGVPRNVRADSPDLRKTQDRLRTVSTADVYDDRDYDRDRGNTSNVELPSTRMLTYRGRDVEFRYPENWQTSEDGDTVTVAPANGVVSGSLAYGATISVFRPEGNLFGQNGLTPTTRADNTSLGRATDQLIDDLRQSNANLRVVRTDNQRRVDGQAALVTEITNDSPLGGRETDWLVTVLRPDGQLHYFIGVAPQREFTRYSSTFDKMVTSLRFYNN